MRVTMSVGLSILPVAMLVGCQANTPEPGAEREAPAEVDEHAPTPTGTPGLIEIRTEEYAFTGPPTFPSGWVTLRLINQGKEPHFLLLWDLPEGKTFDDYHREVSMPFDQLYTAYRAGDLDQPAFFEKLGAAIPAWFFDAVPMGGPGFTAPGHTSEITVHLEPGDNYVMECYVRAMEQGDTFHGNQGMLRPLIVTEEASGMEPPEADVEIVLSSFSIEVTGDLGPGAHVAKVSVADTPQGFVRHNVQLARLEGDMTAEEVAPWLNWVDEMLPPAPAEFLGGAGQTLAGRESYFPFELQPGRYAWISEGFADQGMFREFTVE
jgi:hypothetical protein